jgi:uncharacterized radical SAM protein YgiQ
MPSFDVILVLPYLFSDHPSLPEGLLKKTLEHEGFSVGILETPFWQKKESFTVLGRPNLCFAIVQGPVDSILLNYTSFRKRRNEDLYQEEGKAFFAGYPPSISYKIRPDRTTLVFAARIREAFGDIPIIIGGMEASMRRFAHYDFQQDALRRSILFDSRADILVAGMGEKQLVKIARRLKQGDNIKDIVLPGTSRIASSIEPGVKVQELPSYEEILEDRTKLILAQQIIEKAMAEGKSIVQRHDRRYVIDEVPEEYTSSDLSMAYDQAYSRTHLKQGIYSPALRMNLFSITSHRGCGGGCSFCSIFCHQGKEIISRPVDSILKELNSFMSHPEWKGFVSDIGGPTAEMYGADCAKETCNRRSCLFPSTCKGFGGAQRYLELLRECRKVRGVKKIFIGSGVRYDLLLQYPELLEEIMVHHAGKYLRIAPEHTENSVLRLMGKPPFEILESFMRVFDSINMGLKRSVELAPYLLIGHPGETWEDVAAMKSRIKSLGMKTTDVQAFTPSPGTMSTAMYYAGLSPSSGPIPVVRDVKELMRRKDFLVK